MREDISIDSNTILTSGTSIPYNITQVGGTPNIISSTRVSAYNFIPQNLDNSEYKVDSKRNVLFFKIGNDEFKIICENKIYVVLCDEVYIFESYYDIINEVKVLIKKLKIEKIKELKL